MDMENDQLDLESNIRKGVHVHAADQLPPQKGEEIEEDGLKKLFSSHEGEEEGVGTLRECDQEKNRKRDEKFDRKHPKD